MKKLFSCPRVVFVVLLALAAWGVVGCATTDSPNVSERPWDAPQGWENGMPSSMTDRR
jgi:hypothetical protein